jgi:hypothetical protein
MEIYDYINSPPAPLFMKRGAGGEVELHLINKLQKRKTFCDGAYI